MEFFSVNKLVLPAVCMHERGLKTHSEWLKCANDDALSDITENYSAYQLLLMWGHKLLTYLPWCNSSVFTYNLNGPQHRDMI